MPLSELVLQLDNLSDDDWIGMQRPWSLDAQCRVSRIPDDFHWPATESEQGYAYFLEVATAREVLEPCKPLSMSDRARVLLYYAEHDAWPDWCWKRLTKS